MNEPSQQRPVLASTRGLREQPEVFGRYRLRGLLAQGGMGRLYVAEQAGIQGFVKLVTLRRILPHLAGSSHFRELFVNEARVAASLEHPNIVATYELGEVDGTYFVTMEYLAGEDLAKVLARCATQPMPIVIAVALAQQGANGLHYAHEKRDTPGGLFGLVHRDVNPLNIVVTYFGTVKMLDFGTVKGPSGASTVPGTFKREYAYSSPEQIEGAPVDRRTDVFSLGIVLWECLTGRRLFGGKTDAGTMEAVRAQSIEPPSSVRPDVPRELDAVVLKALARDPNVRYQTTNALSEILEVFLVRNGHRPTSKDVADWLESLFGFERATLKKSIAQGGEVENALARLRAMNSGDEHAAAMAVPASLATTSGKARTLWSTSFSQPGAPGSPSSVANQGARRTPLAGYPTSQRPPTPSRPMTVAPSGAVTSPASTPVRGGESSDASAPSGSRPPRRPSLAPSEGAWPARRRLRTVGIAAAAAVALSVTIYLVAPGAPSSTVATEPRAVQHGAVDVRSQPSGALIIVDGNPTGQTTPAVLSGLPATARPLEIRLNKPGYQPVIRQIHVRAGSRPQLLAFELTRSTGAVHLLDVPKRSVIFLDNNAVDVGVFQSITVGTHKLRVETPEGLLFMGDIDVTPGQQTISIRRGGAAP